MNISIPVEDRVQTHYSCPDLAAAIRAGLERAGKSHDQITTRDLAPVDQLHTGGPKATIALMDRAGLAPHARVLDAGCGMGGSTRLLAERFGFSATGIDISQDFIDTARTLTRWCGLGQNSAIDFHQGSVTHLPFEDGCFDAVLCQHILMNIQDKAGALAEFRRVLRPGGRLILHEIVDGPGPAPLMPVPWAADDSISFMPKPESLKAQLTDAGFRLDYFSDDTQTAATWWQTVNAIREKKGFLPSTPT